jgi:hypothetical protein
MRKLIKWLVILLASPIILLGAMYEFMCEAFDSGRVRYSGCMRKLTDWVEGNTWHAPW